MPVPEIGDDPNSTDSSFDLHEIIIKIFLKASHRWKNHQPHFLMGSYLSYSKGLGFI